ncbi:hypothetical protein HJFPF1_04639 [Paramyrothecium foliicola]|nr:hypothetical protein HJFPF1_04639 [Paramyrothecium foliicola]
MELSWSHSYPTSCYSINMDRDLEALQDSFFDDYAVAWATRFNAAPCGQDDIRVILLETVLGRITTLQSSHQLQAELIDAYNQYMPVVKTWFAKSSRLPRMGDQTQVPWLRYIYAYALWVQGPRFAKLERLRLNGKLPRHECEPCTLNDVSGRECNSVHKEDRKLLGAELLKLQSMRHNQQTYNTFTHLGLSTKEFRAQFVRELKFVKESVGELLHC